MFGRERRNKIPPLLWGAFLLSPGRLPPLGALSPEVLLPSVVIVIAGSFSAAGHAVTILRKVDGRNHRDFETQ